MSHARKREGWTSVMTASDQVGAAKCFAWGPYAGPGGATADDAQEIGRAHV